MRNFDMVSVTAFELSCLTKYPIIIKILAILANRAIIIPHGVSNCLPLIGPIVVLIHFPVTHWSRTTACFDAVTKANAQFGRVGNAVDSDIHRRRHFRGVSRRGFRRRRGDGERHISARVRRR